ncbi:MAG: class I SAM-dependent methyltransferase [Cyclobacteriaceae bacterium]
MIPFSCKSTNTIELDGQIIYSFLDDNPTNIDRTTVKSFGEEWGKFDQFSDQELEQIGDDYFDIVTDQHANLTSIALDVGCGSGRWSKYLSNKVRFIEAIDPSDAVIPASGLLAQNKNVRVTQASADNIPFADNSFDFVFSLGVLHHIPDTQMALHHCISKLKPGGHLLIYLYYNLDNRSFFYKLIFKISHLFRRGICLLPGFIKRLICDLIAFLVYFPLSRFALLLRRIGVKGWSSVPLSYYHDKSLNILRNDALDRFGTPLEQRFSKVQIREMLESEGMNNIIFSEKAPYWHVISQKPE